MSLSEIAQEIVDVVQDPLQPAFFLSAGAGAGKTKALIDAVEELLKRRRQSMACNWQRVAVITYTNVAANEIKARFDAKLGPLSDLVQVSTIHSFCWATVQHLQADLLEWAEGQDSFRDQLENLDGKTPRVIFGPENDRASPRGVVDISLHFQHVLEVFSAFANRCAFRHMLQARFSVLLVDECQDTQKGVVDALLTLLFCKGTTDFTLGFIGDAQQKIYNQGSQRFIEGNWDEVRVTSLSIKQNHRSLPEIVEFANQVRAKLEGKDIGAQGAVRASKSGNEPCILYLEKQVPKGFSADAAFSEKQARQLIAEEEEIESFAKDVFGIEGDWPVDLKDPNRAALRRLYSGHLLGATRFGFASLFKVPDRNELTSRPASDRPGASRSKYAQWVLANLVPYFTASTDRERLDHMRALYCPRYRRFIDAERGTTQAMQSAITALSEVFQGLKDKENSTVADLITFCLDKDLIDPPQLPGLNPSKPLKAESDPKGEAWQQLVSTVTIDPFIKLKNYLSDETAHGTFQSTKGDEFSAIWLSMETDVQVRKGEAKPWGAGAFAKLKDVLTKPTVDKKVGRDFYVSITRAREFIILVHYVQSEKGSLLEIFDKWGFVKRNMNIEGWKVRTFGGPTS